MRQCLHLQKGHLKWGGRRDEETGIRSPAHRISRPGPWWLSAPQNRVTASGACLGVTGVSRAQGEHREMQAGRAEGLWGQRGGPPGSQHRPRRWPGSSSCWPAFVSRVSVVYRCGAEPLGPLTGPSSAASGPGGPNDRCSWTRKPRPCFTQFPYGRPAREGARPEPSIRHQPRLPLTSSTARFAPGWAQTWGRREMN